MKIPEDLSTETQKKICDYHVRHFKKLIELGTGETRAASTVNVHECRRYLSAWVEGALALEVGVAVPVPCAGEMTDALWSGDVDHLLKPEELAIWEAFEDSEAAGEEGSDEL